MTGRTLFILSVTLCGLAPGLSHGQTHATTMAGKWIIDVEASIEASKEMKNERALSGARSLPNTVRCEFLHEGSFTWGKSKGQWSVEEELRDGLQVLFRYPEFERNARVKIVGKDTLHFHFRPDYPVCVYQRVNAAQGL